MYISCHFQSFLQYLQCVSLALMLFSLDGLVHMYLADTMKEVELHFET